MRIWARNRNVHSVSAGKINEIIIHRSIILLLFLFSSISLIYTSLKSLHVILTFCVVTFVDSLSFAFLPSITSMQSKLGRRQCNIDTDLYPHCTRKYTFWQFTFSFLPSTDTIRSATISHIQNNTKWPVEQMNFYVLYSLPSFVFSLPLFCSTMMESKLPQIFEREHRMNVIVLEEILSIKLIRMFHKNFAPTAKYAFAYSLPLYHLRAPGEISLKSVSFCV